MALVEITPVLASLLIKHNFGSNFDFELVGSLVTSSSPIRANDVDFIVRKNDFTNLLIGFDWKESEYFEGESYKIIVGGIPFNAVVLDEPRYSQWKWAADQLKLPTTPAYLKPFNKTDRLAVWEWLVSIAPVVTT
jgi:hypothetical protein